MELTLDTFTLYAAKHYDNPYCFNEEEFHSDLKKIGTIKRMISRLNSGEEVNVHLLVNSFISFYNVFEHHAASNLLQFKMDETHYEKANSILYFLSLPLIFDGSYDIIFHRRIAQHFKHIAGEDDTNENL